MAGGADAGLSGADEGAEGGVVDRLLHVVVVEDEDRSLAAELQRLPREGPARSGSDDAARVGTAGEDELGEPGVLAERLPGAWSEARDHIEDAVGQARLLEDVGEEQGGERRVLGRLHYRGAARGEHRREALAEDHERMVEGRGVAHHADRSPQRIGEVRPFDGNDGVAPREGEAGVVAEEVRDAAHLRARLVDRAAVVGRLELEQFGKPGLEGVGELVDEPRPRADVHPAPLLALEGAGSALDGAVDVRRGAVGGAGDHLAGRRVVDVDLLARRGGNVLPVDEKAVAGDRAIRPGRRCGAHLRLREISYSRS